MPNCASTEMVIAHKMLFGFPLSVPGVMSLVHSNFQFTTMQCTAEAADSCKVVARMSILVVSGNHLLFAFVNAAFHSGVEAATCQPSNKPRTAAEGC